MNDPVRLSVAISEVIAKKGIAVWRATAQLDATWKKIAGDCVASNSRCLYLRNQTVYIGVYSSALLNELVSFHADALTVRFQTECPDICIQKLRFELAVENITSK